MSLVSMGMGLRPAVVVMGFGHVHPLRAHPHTFNTTMWNPDSWGTYRPGDETDPEYALMVPLPTNEFNARSLLISLPRGTVLSPRGIGRLEALIREMKPAGVNIRLRVVDGPTYLEVFDTAEESHGNQ